MRALLLAAAWALADENLTTKRQELSDVQKQIEQKKREIDDFRRQEYELHRDLSKLKHQTQESRRKMGELETRIRSSESKKGELRARVGALKLAEGSWRTVLADELRGYQRLAYTDGGYYGFRGVWEESFRRAAILEKVQYLEGVRGSRRSAEAAEAEVKRLTEALQAKSQGARAEHQNRQSLYQRTEAVYRETHGKVELIQKAIRELQDSALALARLLRTLETKSPYKPAGEKPGLALAKHSLPWPAEGRVVSRFGRQPLKDLGTVMIHQGIRIATAAGSAVRPVAPGNVIFAGPFRSYGLVVIVDHGGGFFSIYGQLGELRAKKGDELQAGSALGTAGEPDARPGEKPQAEGGVVYFEVRQNGEALDPLAWLSPP